MIYLISDTHWNHRMIVEAGHRPADHGKRSIKALQETLKPEDTLIHLGDVIFNQSATLRDILQSIAGTKILVRGNHDSNSGQWYQRMGFAMAVESLSIKYDGKHILFTHIPRPLALMQGCDINVHGHLHTNTHRITNLEDRPADWDNGGRHRLFTLEHRYKPVELRQFLARTDNKPAVASPQPRA